MRLKGGEYASFRECQGDATNRTKLNKLNLVLFKGGANFATNLIFQLEQLNPTYFIFR